MSRGADIALGLAAILVGGAWFHQAAGIEDSLLSDAVGAGGVPMALAAVMAGTGALLVLRSVLRAAPPGETRSMGAHAKAAGLLAMMVAYVLAAPVLGYPLAIGLFAAAVAAYGGARLGWRLAAFGAGVAAFGWLGFAKLLGVAFPTGTIFGG